MSKSTSNTYENCPFIGNAFKLSLSGRIHGNGSWRSIIMLKWFRKGDSLSWNLISTLAVSMGTEWSGAIYWTASPQLSSSLTCCLSTCSIPGSVLMQSGFLCDLPSLRTFKYQFYCLFTSFYKILHFNS